MLAKISDHGPYSNELNWYGDAKSPVESVSKGNPSIVGALVEIICKCDLFFIVPWQQADLFSEKGGRKVKVRLVLLGLVLEWVILPCGAFLLRHVRCGHHGRILI